MRRYSTMEALKGKENILAKKITIKILVMSKKKHLEGIKCTVLHFQKHSYTAACHTLCEGCS